jgi:GNAT superfamily N-acetyltransferase
MTLICPVREEDWRAMRDIRLEALREAPAAFGSCYARETVFTETDWRRRASGHGFFAYLPPYLPGLSAVPVGLVGGIEEGPGEAQLVSMWVSPQARGRQVGTALVTVMVGWARDRGLSRLVLWVTDTNRAARTLYERCGFKATGERQPLPSDPARSEIEMVLAL